MLRTSCSASQICEGGPLITDAGHLVGINFFGNSDTAHVLPTDVILSCLKNWRFPVTIMRPYVGFTVVDAKKTHFQMCERINISLQELYLLVKEVFEGSPAHKNGVRSHDVIASLNETLIVSAQQVCTAGSNGSNEEVRFMADYLAVDDMMFYKCWPQVKGSEWCRKKYGSQENPRFCWPPSPQEETH